MLLAPIEDSTDRRSRVSRVHLNQSPKYSLFLQVFSRELTAADWRRLGKYSSRVKSVTFNRSYKGQKSTAPLYSSVSLFCPTPELVPNLCTLRLSMSNTACIRNVDVLIGPQLKELKILKSITGEENFIFDAIRKKQPVLSSLTVNFERGSLWLPRLLSLPPHLTRCELTFPAVFGQSS